MTSADIAPNVLIIGAARSGTTALATELARHPDVFLSEPKETHFFAYAGTSPEGTGPGDEAMFGRRLVSDPSEFLRLFHAGAKATVRMEGSTSTLYRPPTSIANIVRHASPAVRLIVLLRHPVERAYSNYLYLVGRGYETEPSFRIALEKEDERVRAGWHHIWHYRRLSAYGSQLPPFIERFGRDRMFIATHDEFRSDPTGLLTAVSRFVGVDPSQLPSRRAGEINSGGLPRNRLLGAIAPALSRSERLENVARRLSPHWLREWVRNRSLTSPQLHASLRSELLEVFEPDVRVVEALLDRPLPGWHD